MRVFQNAGLYPAYRPRLSALTRDAIGFDGKLDAFKHDRYGACHVLKPVYDKDSTVIFTNGDDENLQQAWGRENGLARDASLEDILLAQIENHRSEVFYNSHPMMFGNGFLAKLPGCVKLKIAWRAAPSKGGDFDRHDVFLNNFPGILDDFRSKGLRAEYFAPAHDPEMTPYAVNGDRPVDVLFVGGYSRYHKRRAEVLEAVADLGRDFRVHYHLDQSRLLRLAESPFGWAGPLREHRRPKTVRSVSRSPLFGRALYTAISQAKIVLNGAVDMAGPDRGNMRCWEALGCGALLVSDEGRYPEGMTDGETIRTYRDGQDAASTIREMLNAPIAAQELASAGHRMIATRYSKQNQWNDFQSIVAECWP